MKQLFSFLAILTLLFSCRDDDFGNNSNTLQPTNFKVEVKYDASYNDSNNNSRRSKNATVVLVNNNSGDTYTISTDANGFANFSNVIPGTYKITVSKKMLADEFFSTFNYVSPADEINFNGTQEGATVNINVQSTVIELKSARVGDLLIKQIYYAGSHATQGASFRDQFIELYNNSNEVIYVDGLYIGQLYGKVNTTFNQSYTLANGQFDWSKSIGMTAGSAANTDYVYADYVIRIPGTGTQYPILPGESIVIAANGVNHKSPLVDNTGNPISIQNPALTVDLSGANFEVYLGDFNLSIGQPVYKFDIQNPAVKDMEIAYWGRTGYWSGNNDLLMDNPGRDSFIVFKMDKNDFTALPDYSDPSVTNVTASTKYFKQIPNSVIIDGVDLQNFNPNLQRPKMLNASVDASFINCDASFNSQAVIRKTKTTIPAQGSIPARKVLEDTNNSANDFVKQTANPRGFQQ
jgi:hypothetical protein